MAEVNDTPQQEEEQVHQPAKLKGNATRLFIALGLAILMVLTVLAG